MTNRVIPPKELFERLCQDRQIVNKNKQGFADPVLKKRHDEVDFDKEVARINNEFGEV